MRASKCVDAAKPLSTPTADRPRFALIKDTHAFLEVFSVMNSAFSIHSALHGTKRDVIIYGASVQNVCG